MIKSVYSVLLARFDTTKTKQLIPSPSISYA